MANKRIKIHFLQHYGIYFERTILKIFPNLVSYSLYMLR